MLMFALPQGTVKRVLYCFLWRPPNAMYPPCPVLVSQTTALPHSTLFSMQKCEDWPAADTSTMPAQPFPEQTRAFGIGTSHS